MEGRLCEGQIVTDCSIELGNKRSVQAVLEPKDPKEGGGQHYLVRGHCSDEEFEAGRYHPGGVIATARTKGQDWNEAKELMERIVGILETV